MKFLFLLTLTVSTASALEIQSSLINPGTATREDFAVDGIEMPNGTLLVAWGNGTYNTDPRSIVASTSTDGRNWSSTFTLQDVAGKWDTEPQFQVIGSTVYFWSTICDGTVPDDCYITYKTSTDNGATWSAANDIVSDDYLVTTHNPFIKTRAPNIGRIIVPLQTGTPATVADTYWATCIYSDDNYASFQRCGEIEELDSHSYTEPSMVELSDGRLYALLRHYFFNNGGSFQYFSTSSDGGVTWTAAAQSPLVSNNAMAKLMETSPGVYTAIWNEKNTTSSLPRSPLVVAQSTDDCVTFTNKKYIQDDDGRNYSNMGIFVRSNGDIYSVYDDESVAVPFEIYAAGFNFKSAAKGQMTITGSFTMDAQ